MKALRRRYGHARREALDANQVRALLDLLQGKAVNAWHDVVLPNGKHAKMKETLRRNIIFLHVRMPITLRGPGGGAYETSDEMTINATSGVVTTKLG